MFPAVERGQEHLMVEEQIAKGLSFEQIVSANSDDHGRKADCMQCHIHKGLDHISQTFNSIEGSLDTKPSPGRLRYTFKNGKVIDEQVEGIGDLVKKIIIQDEFKQCQVKNFWKRFVGPTDYLDDNPDVLREFVNEFEKNKRRVNSFIRVLVLSKEFRQNNLKTKGNQFYLNAKRVLAKCVDCHGSTQVDFTKVPIGGSQASHQKMISRIVERLALKPLSQAQTATMPPEYSNWFPTQEERKAIVDWIQAGTPDLNGQNQLNNNWIENYYKGEK